MGRILAVLDEETALGFRLSGVEVRTADTVEELRSRVEAVFDDREVRLVIVDEDLVRQLPEKLERRIENSARPLFLPIPTIKGWRGEARPETYAARLIRRAIGYQIKIKR